MVGRKLTIFWRGGGLYLEGLIHVGAYFLEFCGISVFRTVGSFLLRGESRTQGIQRALKLSSHFCQLMSLLYDPL